MGSQGLPSPAWPRDDGELTLDGSGVGLELVALVFLAIPFCGFSGRPVPCLKALCPEGLAGVLLHWPLCWARFGNLAQPPWGFCLGLDDCGPWEEGQILAEGGAQPPLQLCVSPATATARVRCPEWSVQVIRGHALAQGVTAPGSRKMQRPRCPQEELLTLHPVF